ncbi:hypothetical protein L226DRAFT_528988 [Lentinus tigrinus ALCF2SS1-7]|uniref:Uncharacterized protein n=1 Tax=Lentinus tigrinus ALCF2SS1-6 TaxID=1328759 RepID=A0A5C2SLH6_9APHY|nr:hypothetical protein L227DRAFT_571104 [Lentinus tigrinus ALCF2SS1-6]RPD82862.1 hypothetical protein L226DRAFT_528988 [Lentinus tigrinus ALCF2SS1-7]
MLLLTWGCAWFAMSVLIFGIGCLLPSLLPKPPPLIQKPRIAKSRSTPALRADPEPLPHQPEDEPSSSVEFRPTLQRAATVEEASPVSTPLKRPAYKTLWPLAHHPARSIANSQPDDPTPTLRRAATFSEVLSSLSSSSKVSAIKSVIKNGRSTPGPKASVSSGSEELVDPLSPTRYHPDLTPIVSATPSAEGSYAQEASVPSSSSSPTLAGSPRSWRHTRLPSMKMFKSFSKRMSPKSKTDPASHSPTADASILYDTVGPKEQCTDERPRHAHPDRLRRHHDTSAEVLTTKFVNPFHVKPRKSQSIERSASPSPSPSSRRVSGPRRMLAPLKFIHANESHVSAVPDSPRSSVSSESTGLSTFSSPSVKSSFSSASSSSPRSVPPRTQPYGAPYYAATPAPRERPSSRPAARRAASVSLDRPETVAEESGEDSGNALGLELGHARKGNAATMPVHQRKRFFRHRSTASEGEALGAAAR